MLTDRDKAILDFEDRVWRSTAAKEDAILIELGLKVVVYYRLLGVIAATPEALEYNPQLIHRLVDAEYRRAQKRARKQL